eukprot:279606_1
MNNIQINMEQKYFDDEEEEHKFNPDPHPDETEIMHSKLPEFVQPRQSDYIDCTSKDHQIEICNVIKRIVHLIIWYQQHENVNIYEYLSLLKNYDIPTFMEDWHTMKNNHLRDVEGVEYIRKYIGISCDNVQGCQYVRRYQRERGKEIYDNMKIEIDYKNIILKDQLDSIHAFIFHSSQQRHEHS